MIFSYLILMWKMPNKIKIYNLNSSFGIHRCNLIIEEEDAVVYHNWIFILNYLYLAAWKIVIWMVIIEKEEK